MGFNKGVEEQMIIQIEIIGYAVIGLILTITTAVLLVDNIKLRYDFKKKMQEMKELEMEMRFKFDLRK